MQDYTGFSFGPYYSKDLGILRVSDGSRYTEELSPPMKDKVISLEGSSTSYFLETTYTPRNFSIRIAYDKLTEVQLNQLRRVFSGKEVRPLIFDEKPYKAYMVKVQSPINLTYIPFDDERQRYVKERIYKGEGTISFIAYDPLAYSIGRYLSDYPDNEFSNKGEWARSTRMKLKQGIYDQPGQTVYLYNAGDVETELLIYYLVEEVEGQELWIKIEGEDKAIKLRDIERQGSDSYLRVNTKTHLVEGCDLNGQKTGTIYNQFIVAGKFFKLKQGHSELFTSIPCESVDYQHRYY